MQLPVWQEFYAATRETETELLAVAIDFQGAELPRPYIEQANPTYENAIDAENLLAMNLGFQAIPNAVFVDETGIIRYAKFGGFDIRKPEFRLVAEQFAVGDRAPKTEELAAGGFVTDEARSHFSSGMVHFQQGRRDAALAEWRKGLLHEPENWIIRKQIWAIENPDKFYSGDVDFDWQREQIARNQ